MRAALVLLLGLIALSNAGTFTADFEMRAPYLRNGVINGVLQYNFGQANGEKGYMKFDYTKQGYYEIHEYNGGKGYGSGVTALAQQWNYKVGQTCGCETGALDNVMPALSNAAGSTELAKLTAGFDGPTQVTVRNVAYSMYTLKNDANKPQYSGVDSFAVRIGFVGNAPGYIQYDDGREFTLKNVRPNIPAGLGEFAAPPTCKCGRPIDIAIVLDRSGSINAIEWKDQKAFVLGFVNQFDYGALGANVAIINFNKIFWVNLTLAEGSSKANTVNKVESMKCCEPKADDYVNNPDVSCCCCGTSISGGMQHGAVELKKSTRSQATKVLLVITDGYHNTQENGDSCGVFAPLFNNSACQGDLYNTVHNIVEPMIPNVIIYAVGVGSEREFSAAELIVCAQGDPAKVLTAGTFAELAQKTLELVARTCDENESPCGAGCCGFCVCKECKAVEACDAPADPCKLSAVPQGSICCATTDKQCNPNTPCVTYACTAGSCNGTAVPKPTDTPCRTYKCDPLVGIVSTDIPCAGGPQPECTAANVAVNCDDKNGCTKDECDLTLAVAKCKWTQIDCSKQAGFAPDMCSQVDCTPAGGCKRTPFDKNYCDDNNVCTNDSCVLGKGCVHVLINCNDTNLCTTDTCHPTLGCVHSPKVCNASLQEIANQQGVDVNKINSNCTLGFCENGTCKSRLLDCPAPFTTAVAIGAGIGTAALAAIIVCAILCAAGVAGGGAYAYSQAAGAGNLSVTGNNPLYAGNKNAGMNPLYKNV